MRNIRVGAGDVAGMKPLINTTKAVTDSITNVYWPAMMDSITRMP